MDGDSSEGKNEVARLLAAVRRLEWVGRKNVASLLTGAYATSILGRGMLFREPRKYTPGQPARAIDWNITARLDEPYVRVHEEERQRDVFLAVDTSPTMHTGFGVRSKLETAVELAATLAVSVEATGDRLGLVIFADRALLTVRPRVGKKQLFRVLRGLLEHTGPWRRPVAASDPRTAIHAVQGHRGAGCALFLISDFIDHDLPDDLRHVRARHDVSMLHVYDPFELEADPVWRFAARSPEGAGVPVALHNGVHRGAHHDLEATRRFLEAHAGRHGIDTASFSTNESIREGLARFFARKRSTQHGRHPWST